MNRAPGVATLLRLAWPIIVSRSCQVVIGLTDAAMVAPLGDAPLAASTTGALNSFFFFIVPIGTIHIVGSFASQLFGAGDPAGARRFGWYGLLVCAALQVLVFAAIPFLPAALAAFDFEPGLRDEMAAYMRIRVASAGPAVGIEALAAYYGGLGNTRLPMLANATAMALNFPLNGALIHGNFGAPALGVVGAAWGSLLSTTIAFAGLFACFVAGVGAPGGAVRSRLHGPEFLRMLRFGVPNGVNWFFEFAAFTLFINAVVGSQGTVPLAAMMAVIQVNHASFMPAFGIGTAGAILVGQSIGAGRKDDVPAIVRRTFAVTGAWQGIVGLLYFTIPATLLSLFTIGGRDASAFLEIGVPMLVVSAGWQLFDAAGITLTEALRAAGDTAFCLWARLGLGWALWVPLALVWTKRLGGGPIEALLSLWIYLAVLAGVLYWRFRSGRWRTIDLTGRDASALTHQ